MVSKSLQPFFFLSTDLKNFLVTDFFCIFSPKYSQSTWLTGKSQSVQNLDTKLQAAFFRSVFEEERRLRQ